MLALFGLGGGEIVLILAAFLVFCAVVAGFLVLLVYLLRKKNDAPASPPPATPTKRVCPQCGKELSPDAPQGLCPACLMKVGVGSHFGPANQPPQQPGPAITVAEIAPLFPQLEILELLGQGGMGMVYKARQPALDRVVALKVLSPHLSKDPAFAERFLREAKALGRLNHPNIVGVYDFGKAGDLYYFLMEYVDGMNLWQLEQSKKRLTPEEAFSIVPRICDALQYAHDEGIVHRDIKPGNILIDKKGRVKIADFGLAKLLGKEPQPFGITQSRMTMGTPHYMAPEQIEKPLDVDHRADIYSLGVVFYEMLTGELPIGRFPLPSERVQVDVRLDEVVLRTLEKEPHRRYQHANQVKTAVEDLSGNATQATYSNGPEYKSKRTLFGLPLIHITQGIDPTTRKVRQAKGILAIGGSAKGVFAFGGKAIGLFAFGGVAIGGFCFGGLAIGLFPFGALALGLLSIGGLAFGLIGAYGGIAVAPLAMGGAAAGYVAAGGLAFGKYVASARGVHPLARPFATLMQSGLSTIIITGISCFGGAISALVPIYFSRRLLSKRDSKASSTMFMWTAFVVVIGVVMFLAAMAVTVNTLRNRYGRLRPTPPAPLHMGIATNVFDWNDVIRRGNWPGAVVEETAVGPALKIENANDTSLQFPIVKIENPTITGERYSVWGEIKYEAVEQEGHLEMWNYFPPPPGMTVGMQLYSGPGDKLSSGTAIWGTSDWRPFALNFDRGSSEERTLVQSIATKQLPLRLELNLFLPGRGTVFVRRLKVGNTPYEVPTGAVPIVLDDNAAVFEGDWIKVGRSEKPEEKFGPNYYWRSATSTSNNVAKYTPVLPSPGKYHVELWYPAGFNRSRNARWTISTAQKHYEVSVNQSINGGQWLRIANAVPFAADGKDYVSLQSTVIPEPGRVIVADAVRFVPANPDEETSAPLGEAEPLNSDEIVMDNRQVVFTGMWTLATSAPEKFGADYYFASSRNEGAAPTATYVPVISKAGLYDVQLWYGNGANRSTNALVEICCDGVTNRVVVDQRRSGGKWIKIATASFSHGQRDFIRVSATGERGAIVIADGVRLVRVNAVKPGDDSR